MMNPAMVSPYLHPAYLQMMQTMSGAPSPMPAAETPPANMKRVDTRVKLKVQASVVKLPARIMWGIC